MFVSRIQKELFERELTKVDKFKLENNLFYLSKYNLLFKKNNIYDRCQVPDTSAAGDDKGDLA